MKEELLQIFPTPLLIVAPNVSAESSIIFNLYFFAILFILIQSGVFPIKLGIINAFVFFEIAFSILFISICKVSISISTKTGASSSLIRADNAVPKFKHGIITSSPFFNNYLCLLIFLPLCMYKLCYTK